ncbi:hypothetical protein BGZ65_010349 [Modicella reniformis]|uniref:FAS1 domain-containing protein n=1 Tax=Modicella reniformis TaxID=1440133 RepID=A0A9P6IML6_9FUNG|nr:hypothetical protein BGZ65_010349 [Modicella reniformis]
MRPERMGAVLLLLFTCLLATLQVVVASKTVIDLVSSDPAFSRLIRELQRHRLIVLLNNRKSCTFFAPTNAAFTKWEEQNKDKQIDKDTLLYHILGNNLNTEYMKAEMLLESLLVWDGYLGKNKEGQLIKVTKPKWRPGRKFGLVVGGAELLKKDWRADNGIVHVVDRLFTLPEDLVKTMQKHDELSELHNLIHAAGLDGLLQKHRPYTLFAPTGDAIKRLSDVQLNYLRHEEGRDDLTSTFHHHIHWGTLYKKDIQQGTSTVSTLEGEDLTINLDDKLLIDNAEVETTDILASNGVIHTVSRPLLPSALTWTPAKYLIGLNAANFVKAVRKAGLSRYIDDPNSSYTIFAPQDDVFSPESLTGREKSDMLQYHFVSGKIAQNDLQDGQLLQTELRTDQLNGQAQRSKINVKKDKKKTTISINGIEVKGEPVQLQNSVIYLVTRPLELPLPLVKKMKQDESLSGFYKALTSIGLDRKLSDARGVTVFAPSTAAWGELGVVANFLRLDEQVSKEALEAVARYAIVDNLHYTPDLKAGRTVLKTSQGSELIVEKSNDAIYVGEGRLERSDQVGGQITEKDILVESGVVHAVSAVALPPTLAITLYNVLQGSGASDFLEAFETSNITQILTNWEQDFTIFAPTDEAFQEANLEDALNDADFVGRLVRLHVIPGKILKLEENVKNVEPSLLNNDARLSLRDIDHDGKSFGVRVKGAPARKEAKIVNKGYAHHAWSNDDENPGDLRKTARVKQQHASDDARGASVVSTVPLPGGVIYVIDRVLLPGDPEPISSAWFWIAIAVVGILAAIILCILSVILGVALAKELQHSQGYQPVASGEGAARGADGA